VALVDRRSCQGALYQPPPGFGLGLQRGLRVGLRGQHEQFVGESDTAQRLLPFVDEEARADIRPVDDVEGVILRVIDPNKAVVETSSSWVIRPALK
jgi:hypothetical protein